MLFGDYVGTAIGKLYGTFMVKFNAIDLVAISFFEKWRKFRKVSKSKCICTVFFFCFFKMDHRLCS